MGQGGEKLFTIIATIRITRPDVRERYLEALLDDARGSVRDEPGCFRFDVIADSKDPNTLYLYEIYRDEAAFQEHLKAPHFRRWREIVDGWDEISAVRGATVFPAEADWAKQPLSAGE